MYLVHTRRMVCAYKYILITCGDNDLEALRNDLYSPNKASMSFDLYFIRHVFFAKQEDNE